MKIQQDKIKHFAVGVIASAFVCAVTQDWVIGILVAVILGTGKEIYDGQGNGTVELLDVMATVIGGVVAAIAYGLIIMIGG